MAHVRLDTENKRRLDHWRKRIERNTQGVRPSLSKAANIVLKIGLEMEERRPDHQPTP